MKNTQNKATRSKLSNQVIYSIYLEELLCGAKEFGVTCFVLHRCQNQVWDPFPQFSQFLQIISIFVIFLRPQIKDSVLDVSFLSRVLFFPLLKINYSDQHLHGHATVTFININLPSAIYLEMSVKRRQQTLLVLLTFI